MGLIRKTASLSTLGGVKYTSRREAETKERIANARLANQRAKTERTEREQATPVSDSPWRQPTLGGAIATALEKRRNNREKV